MQKVFNNFADLSRVFKIKPRNNGKSEEIRICRKCGGKMRLLEGTNIFVCEGNNGKECHNRSIKRVLGFSGEGSPSYTPKVNRSKPF